MTDLLALLGDSPALVSALIFCLGGFGLLARAHAEVARERAYARRLANEEARRRLALTGPTPPPPPALSHEDSTDDPHRPRDDS